MANDSFSPGRWYTTGNDVISLYKWCIERKMPFFMFYTNLAGGCKYCEKWDKDVVNTAAFNAYMSTSKLYFAVINGGRYTIVDNAITRLCGGQVNMFPFGLFYANPTFNEYFERLNSNKT